MQGYYKIELQQSRKYRKSTVRGLLAIGKKEKNVRIVINVRTIAI